MPLSQESRAGVVMAILVGNMFFWTLIIPSQPKSQRSIRSSKHRVPKPAIALSVPQAEREGVTWTTRDLAQFLRSSGAIVADDMIVQTAVRERPVTNFIRTGKVVLQVMQFDSPEKAQNFSKDRNEGESFVWARFAIVGQKPDVDAARKALVK